MAFVNNAGYVPGTERDLARAPQNYTWVKRKRGDLLARGLYLDMPP